MLMCDWLHQVAESAEIARLKQDNAVLAQKNAALARQQQEAARQREIDALVAAATADAVAKQIAAEKEAALNKAESAKNVRPCPFSCADSSPVLR